MDSPTATRQRLAYARIFVEVSAKAELPTSVPILMPSGNLFSQKVVYEWLPPRCSGCISIGHKIQECPFKGQEIWRPKATNITREEGDVEVTRNEEGDGEGVDTPGENQGEIDRTEQMQVDEAPETEKIATLDEGDSTVIRNNPIYNEDGSNDQQQRVQSGTVETTEDDMEITEEISDERDTETEREETGQNQVGPIRHTSQVQEMNITGDPTESMAEAQVEIPSNDDGNQGIQEEVIVTGSNSTTANSSYHTYNPEWIRKMDGYRQNDKEGTETGREKEGAKYGLRNNPKGNKKYENPKVIKKIKKTFSNPNVRAKRQAQTEPSN